MAKHNARHIQQCAACGFPLSHPIGRCSECGLVRTEQERARATLIRKRLLAVAVCLVPLAILGFRVQDLRERGIIGIVPTTLLILGPLGNNSIVDEIDERDVRNRLFNWQKKIALERATRQFIESFVLVQGNIYRYEIFPWINGKKERVILIFNFADDTERLIGIVRLSPRSQTASYLPSGFPSMTVALDNVDPAVVSTVRVQLLEMNYAQAVSISAPIERSSSSVLADVTSLLPRAYP